MGGLIFIMGLMGKTQKSGRGVLLTGVGFKLGICDLGMCFVA